MQLELEEDRFNDHLTSSGGDPMGFGISLAVWRAAFSRTLTFKAIAKAAKVATLTESTERNVDHCATLPTSFKTVTTRNDVVSTTLSVAATMPVDKSRQLRVPRAAMLM